ncbi:lysophospholipid acyltransferase family protein [Selenihalanaerobacter shriftii]|uniref:1-acyl-sn-glycerol-3-phosphate acyltransferase n=1 Tax=Selenihalanaerobacter shriftii TaxID=142842 RepID=A0A1T4LII9_9FIRM|nr:lysophospholipid acyltransferase family protein [Selenihalanaerobacter shriftii]SJZ54555.1 1-acyl-sn-glycerol-3-phosphate acyltransferase [Selenihalanaerobacter shriftii]
MNGNLTYKFGHFIFSTFFRFATGWDVEGRENIPEDGPVIVAANHISNWDPPVLGSSLTRPVHYIAKKELFEVPVLGDILNHMGMIPINRGKPDRNAIREALNILKNGEVLGVFPEGTRSKTGKLRRAKLGIVMIALRFKAPILPVGLSNTNQPFKSRMKVKIGKPFTLDEYYDQKLDKKEMREVGAKIMGEIKLLLE